MDIVSNFSYMIYPKSFSGLFYTRLILKKKI